MFVNAKTANANNQTGNNQTVTFQIVEKFKYFKFEFQINMYSLSPLREPRG